MKDGFWNKKFKYSYWDACSWLIGACVLVYAITIIFPVNIGGISVMYWLSLIPGFVRHGYVWQFVTYMFVHGNPLHLLLNMYALLVFGRPLERSFGSREFLLFYFVTGALGGVISYVIYLLTGLANVAIMGASGAIYAMLFLTSVTFPTVRILLFFFIPLKMPVAVMVFIALEVFSQLTGGGADVAHLVHLTSIAVAWIYCVVRFRISPWKVWKEVL